MTRALKMSCVLTAIVALLGSGTGHACVGANCLDIWSTADGGGALTIRWDFTKKVQTFLGPCSQDNSLCLYSTVDPGFMALTVDDDPNDSYYVLQDNTVVNLVIVAADAAVSLNINGQRLNQPGNTARLGIMPPIHNHPSWQVVVPGDQFGDYSISYKLTTDSPAYVDSQVFTSIVTNVPPPDAGTPTPTATPVPTPVCVGDCNGDGTVLIDELLEGVNMALGDLAVDQCPALDPSHDGEVTIDEILTAINNALDGCPMPPPATFDEIQRTIFTPSCATSSCHDAQSRTGNLTLAEGLAYDQLVGVQPDIFSARNAGLLRVKPDAPDESFLLIKVTGPPLDQGSPMPLTGPRLSADQIQLIRDWILQGAKP